MRKTPFLHILVLIAFLANTFGPLAQAQELRLPAPGVRINLSPEFNPPILKGIKVDPSNPFRFDFILDKGDGFIRHPEQSEGSQQEQLKQESTRLIKYFLASLTIPENDLWVNLSPYEKDRIIPNNFGLTEMGRDLLAEDYMLKQITASLVYPEGETGKKFWKRIYEQAAKKFGTTNIPVNTFNKVWIIPEKAVVYENAKAGTAYVVESKLKVMLEQDYLALQKGTDSNSAVRPILGQELVSVPNNAVNALGSNIIREIVIPELTKEVNENKNFAHLRQVYNSLILATWYKKKIKDSILAQVYADKNKIKGIEGTPPNDVEAIYQRYLQAFKKGVYNYIKEEPDPLTQETIPRKYFSGGIKWNMDKEIFTSRFPDIAQFNTSNLIEVSSDFAMFGFPKNNILNSKVEMASNELNMNGVKSTIDVVKKLTFGPEYKIREASFEIDGWGQMNVVRIILGNKSGKAVKERVTLGNGEIFNFSYDNGMPCIWIDRQEGPWLFTGYLVVEKGKLGLENHYRMAVQSFGKIPALESDRHTAMYYFLKILSRKNYNVTLVNFDLHHDNFNILKLRGVEIKAPLNLGNWVRKVKQQGYVKRVVWVPPLWYRIDFGDIKEARDLDIVDLIEKDLSKIKVSFPIAATVDFDYISSIGPPLVSEATKEQIDEDVENIMTFFSGIKNSLIGINFNRSAFAWNGENYSPQQSSAYIMNAFVSKANKFLGEAHQVKVKYYLSTRVAKKVHANAAMTSLKFSRAVLPAILALFLSASASFAQNPPFELKDIPFELRNTSRVSFMGHLHANPVLNKNLDDKIKEYMKSANLRGKGDAIDQATKDDISRTNKNFRLIIKSLREGMSKLDNIGVESSPNDWQGLIQYGNDLVNRLPEILLRMGYQKDNIKQLSDDILLYLCGPVAYLWIMNDPMIHHENIIPLEDDKAKKKSLEIVFSANLILQDIIRIDRPDLLVGSSITLDQLPMDIRNLMNYSDAILYDRGSYQEEKMTLDAFSEQVRPFANAYLDRMKDLLTSVKERNNIIAGVIEHTKGRIVVVIGGGHVQDLVAKLREHDNAMVATDEIENKILMALGIDDKKAQTKIYHSETRIGGQSIKITRYINAPGENVPFLRVGPFIVVDSKLVPKLDERINNYPFLIKRNITELINGEIANGDVDYKMGWSFYMAGILASMVAYADQLRGSNFIDFGAGFSGILAVAAEKLGAASIILIEENERYIEQLKLNIASNSDNPEKYVYINDNFEDMENIEGLDSNLSAVFALDLPFYGNAHLMYQSSLITEFEAVLNLVGSNFKLGFLAGGSEDYAGEVRNVLIENSFGLQESITDQKINDEQNFLNKFTTFVITPPNQAMVVNVVHTVKEGETVESILFAYLGISPNRIRHLLIDLDKHFVEANPWVNKELKAGERIEIREAKPGMIVQKVYTVPEGIGQSFREIEGIIYPTNGSDLEKGERASALSPEFRARYKLDGKIPAKQEILVGFNKSEWAVFSEKRLPMPEGLADRDQAMAVQLTSEEKRIARDLYHILSMLGTGTVDTDALYQRLKDRKGNSNVKMDEMLRVIDISKLVGDLRSRISNIKERLTKVQQIRRARVQIELAILSNHPEGITAKGIWQELIKIQVNGEEIFAGTHLTVVYNDVSEFDPSLLKNFRWATAKKTRDPARDKNDQMAAVNRAMTVNETRAKKLEDYLQKNRFKIRWDSLIFKTIRGFINILRNKKYNQKSDKELINLLEGVAAFHYYGQVGHVKAFRGIIKIKDFLKGDDSDQEIQQSLGLLGYKNRYLMELDTENSRVPLDEREMQVMFKASDQKAIERIAMGHFKDLWPTLLKAYLAKSTNKKVLEQINTVLGKEYEINPDKKMENKEPPLLSWVAGDKAMEAKNGGIDLTPAHMQLQVNAGSTNEGIKFHLDAAMLEQLQNAPGFVPVIINVQPLKDLRAFLGIVNQTK